MTVVGAGPAGLMAAEAAAGAGAEVTIIDQRRSFGRTLLLAGRSGLNLTHAEPLGVFLGRYGDGRAMLEPAIRAFPPDAVRAWADELGADTFVGSSGRVFPAAMRATGLLRAWTARLAGLGVAMRTGETWAGFTDDGATVLALGGASWPSVGGDGSWLAHVETAGIPVVPFVASNAGVLVAWSAPLLERFEGVPIKNAALTAGVRTVRGEPTITATGLEGGPIYALGPELRSGHGLEIDLQPDLDADALAARLVDRRRPKDSVSTWLRKGGLSPVDVALLRDATANRLPTEATAIANLAKAVPIPVGGLAPIDRAISTAGGVALDAIDDTGMLLGRPGTWVAGEMVAWDAPTGGYLIQACLSTGHRAGVAAARWAAEHP
ncbi:MAG TPA: aminoacetone oxidase family FAD-binding enzyme [Acidimicrobiaceae bacterium]|nr:aminoacetone oxidase family FAD-binding enzyme [Acidimicrobiaceae bacterium]